MTWQAIVTLKNSLEIATLRARLRLRRAPRRPNAALGTTTTKWTAKHRSRVREERTLVLKNWTLCVNEYIVGVY